MFKFNVLNNNNNKHYSRNESLGDVFAERSSRTIRNLPKRPVFEKGIVIGLIYYLFKQNRKLIEYILLVK